VALGGFISNALTVGFFFFLILGMVWHGLSNAAASFIAGDAAIAVVILVGLLALFTLYWLYRVIPEDLKPVQSGEIIGYAIRGRPSAPAVPVGARFCSNCGARVSPRATFCSNCGSKLR